jgi:hypothetical protein
MLAAAAALAEAIALCQLSSLAATAAHPAFTQLAAAALSARMALHRPQARQAWQARL